MTKQEEDQQIDVLLTLITNILDTLSKIAIEHEQRIKKLEQKGRS